jgi:hypothetical protein
MRAVFSNQEANASLKASFVQLEILFHRGESLQRARRRCAQFTDDTDRQADEDEAQDLLILWRRLCRHRRPRPQPPPNHIQHITAIAQRNGAEQGEIAEDERLALDRTAHGQVLKHLGNCANSVVGSVGGMSSGAWVSTNRVGMSLQLLVNAMKRLSGWGIGFS